jgi:GrpB-like predicted nucleotidyltransferase (UPF0157 family)
MPDASRLRTIVVVDYDPAWPRAFEQVRAHVWPMVSTVAVAVEHVGSTSVPGLAAKPIIDISIVVPDASAVPRAIAALATLGYEHLGEMGVEGREAFRSPDGLPAHNLYVCPAGSLGLTNQITVRDYLRARPDAAAAYADLKKRLAVQFPHDIDRYVEGKTDMVLDILRRSGFPADRLEAVERANRPQRDGAAQPGSRNPPMRDE